METGNERLRPSERANHRQRVAELSRRAARIAGLADGLAAALVIAAQTHGDGPFRAPLQWLGEPDSPETRIARDTSAILLHQSSNSPMALAIQLFEGCDALDEAIEFSPFEGRPASEAITEFFEEAASRFDERTVGALRQLTAVRYRPSLDTGVPVFPRAAARLLQTSAETTSAFELESIVSADPVFSAQILGAANSVCFGGREEIRQLGHGIMRVGVPFARKILISACLGQIFSSGALAKLWKHSKTVAAIAHELAASRGYNQEEAFAAGLLHDIGRILLRRAPAQAREEESALLAAGFPLTYAETLVYGKDHAALGAELLTKWGLPEEMVDAVRLHHFPEKSSSVLAGILYLAEEEAGDSGADARHENLASGVRSAFARQTTGIRDTQAAISPDAPIFSLTV